LIKTQILVNNTMQQLMYHIHVSLIKIHKHGQLTQILILINKINKIIIITIIITTIITIKITKRTKITITIIIKIINKAITIYKAITIKKHLTINIIIKKTLNLIKIKHNQTQ